MRRFMLVCPSMDTSGGSVGPAHPPGMAYGLPNWVRGKRMASGRLRGPRVQVFPKSSSNLLHEAGGRSPGHVSVVTSQRPPRCVQPAAASSGAVNSRCGPATSELRFRTSFAGPRHNEFPHKSKQISIQIEPLGACRVLIKSGYIEPTISR